MILGEGVSSCPIRLQFGTPKGFLVAELLLAGVEAPLSNEPIRPLYPFPVQPSELK